MPDNTPVNDRAILASAARVFELEGAALRRMGAAIPADFAAVVRRILDTTGRVILSGIGKSGHVGLKIASTLASTGTPAFFVHPAEASHGDLGMITAQDVCILISNSGETAELDDLIRYTRRFSIPLIAITGRATGTLARAADLRLILPDEPEACPIGLAPTTSTTLTLALGDALAVALMEARGFVPEDFRALHPGGKLGARLLSVEQVMHGSEALALVGPDTPMEEVLLRMSEKGFGLACLVEGGTLAGVISDGDLRRHARGLMGKSAGEVATRNPRTIAPGALAAEALAEMNAAMISALVAVDAEGRPVGILRVHDCLRAGIA